MEAILDRSIRQMEFMKRVAHTMDEEHCRIHRKLLQKLQAKLEAAVSEIDSVVKPGEEDVKRLKFAWVRGAIDEAVEQLEKWQRIFDPTWYLILRISDALIDTELSKPGGSVLSASATLSGSTLPPMALSGSSLLSAQRLREVLRSQPADLHVTLSEVGLLWDNARSVGLSTARVVRRVDLKRTYVVDTIDCSGALDVARARADAEALAKTLYHIEDGAFGLLSCRGIVKRKDPETGRLASINLIFRMPGDDAEPSSLRHLLGQQPPASLTHVLDIARQLAKAVSFVHTCDFVHKNIRPETILVFPGVGKPLGSAYLVGFDSFRSVNFHTARVGDGAWERNLYRHPSRQGAQVQRKYVMQHDVYGLGVCLLELGLWESFVRYGEAGLKAAVPYPGLDLTADLDVGRDGTKIKEKMVELAKEELPRKMGDRYTRVVVTCLTCLDQGNEEFGKGEMTDEDGILVGVRFIEKVLMRLGDIEV